MGVRRSSGIVRAGTDQILAGPHDQLYSDRVELTALGFAIYSCVIFEGSAPVGRQVVTLLSQQPYRPGKT